MLETLGFTRRERLALSRELVRRGHAEYVFERVRSALRAFTRLTGLDECALKEAMEEWWEALSWLTVEPEFLELFRSERWTRETVEDPEPTRLETLAAMCVIRLAVSWIRFDEEGGEKQIHTGSRGLKMVGVPHYMVGGYVETGAELNGIDEPVRSLNDALKPKLYTYDRYADAYLRAST